MIESAFKQKGGMQGELANVPVSYRAPGKIVGLDETGGIIQLKFPMTKGSKVELDNAILKELWEGESIVQISEIAKMPNNPGVWQAKFLTEKASGNKAKYWEKISSAMKDQMEPDLDDAS